MPDKTSGSGSGDAPPDDGPSPTRTRRKRRMLREVTVRGHGRRVVGGPETEVINARGNRNLLDGGRGDDVLIAHGDDNVLTGGDGDDVLISVGVNNLLVGGAGNDTYMVRLGEGTLVINEQRGGGFDRLVIKGVPEVTIAKGFALFEPDQANAEMLRIGIRTGTRTVAVGGIVDWRHPASQVELLQVESDGGARASYDLMPVYKKVMEAGQAVLSLGLGALCDPRTLRRLIAPKS